MFATIFAFDSDLVSPRSTTASGMSARALESLSLPDRHQKHLIRKQDTMYVLIIRYTMNNIQWKGKKVVLVSVYVVIWYHIFYIDHFAWSHCDYGPLTKFYKYETQVDRKSMLEIGCDRESSCLTVALYLTFSSTLAVRHIIPSIQNTVIVQAGKQTQVILE